MTEGRQTMGDQRSRLGAANLSILLMLMAFLIIAGFLWWLNANAESVEIVVQERRTEEVATPDGTAVAVTDEQLSETPQQFVGQVVQISDAPVAMAVGSQAFFLDFPDAPFLVKLGESLVEQGEAVPQGQVTVEGPLMAMTDSIIADWMERGVIAPADEILVEFSTYFIEARRVGAPGAPDGDDR